MPAELGVPALEEPRTHRPRRVVPLDEETRELLRVLKVGMRRAIDCRTLKQSAGLADCSTNTLIRILRGENVSLATLARIIHRLGAQMSISVERKRQV